ncbi:hypothetical protein QOT17_004048 [Balamuthia mandrillaris]
MANKKRGRCRKFLSRETFNKDCLIWFLRPHYYHHEPSDLATSWFVPAWVLFLYRLVAFAYILTITVLKIVFDHRHGKMFIYFTNLNYILLPGYFAVGVTLGVIYLGHKWGLPLLDEFGDWYYRRGRKADKQERTHLNIVEFIYWIGFPLAVTNALFLDIVYWAAIFGVEEEEDESRREGFLLFLTINVHAINALWLLGELILTRMDVFFLYIICPIAYGMTYLIFAWIRYAIAENWVYDILDWDDPVNAVYYVIIWPIGMACFLVVMAATWFRNWVAFKLGRYHRDRTKQKQETNDKQHQQRKEEREMEQFSVDDDEEEHPQV